MESTRYLSWRSYLVLGSATAAVAMAAEAAVSLCCCGVFASPPLSLWPRNKKQGKRNRGGEGNLFA